MVLICYQKGQIFLTDLYYSDLLMEDYIVTERFNYFFLAVYKKNYEVFKVTGFLPHLIQEVQKMHR